MRTIALALVLVVSIYNVQAEESKSCNPYMFKDCCIMPQLISRDVFETCLKEVGGKSKVLFEKFRARIKKKKGKIATTTAIPSKGRTSSRKARAAEDEKTGPICMMNCVMEKEGMLKNGVLNIEVIKEKFTSKAIAEWKPLVEAAAKNASNDLAKLEASKIPTEPCSSLAAFFMTYIRRDLTINCPPFAKSETYNRDNFCVNNKKGLLTCDPFYVDKAMKQSKTVQEKNKKTAKIPKKDSVANGKKTTGNNQAAAAGKKVQSGKKTSARTQNQKQKGKTVTPSG